MKKGSLTWKLELFSCSGKGGAEGSLWTSSDGINDGE